MEEKIHKLLSLCLDKGAAPGEAVSALERARSLADKHQIDLGLFLKDPFDIPQHTEDYSYNSFEDSEVDFHTQQSDLQYFRDIQKVLTLHNDVIGLMSKYLELIEQYRELLFNQDAVGILSGMAETMLDVPMCVNLLNPPPTAGNLQELLLVGGNAYADLSETLKCLSEDLRSYETESVTPKLQQVSRLLGTIDRSFSSIEALLSQYQ